VKITIESTLRTVAINGAPGRVWQGTSARGMPVVIVIVRMAVPCDVPQGDVMGCVEPNDKSLEAFPDLERYEGDRT